MKIQTSKEVRKHHYIAEMSDKDTVSVKVGDIEFVMRYNVITASIEFYSFAGLSPFFEINKSQLLHALKEGVGEYTCLTLPTDEYKKIKPLLKEVLMIKP